MIAIGGTNATSSESVDIDLDFKLVSVDPVYFPRAEKKGVMVHQGFYGAFERVLPGIDAGVQAGIKEGAKRVVVTGHSMGESYLSSLQINDKQCGVKADGRWGAGVSCRYALAAQIQDCPVLR